MTKQWLIDKLKIIQHNPFSLQKDFIRLNYLTHKNIVTDDK